MINLFIVLPYSFMLFYPVYLPYLVSYCQSAKGKLRILLVESEKAFNPTD